MLEEVQSYANFMNEMGVCGEKTQWEDVPPGFGIEISQEEISLRYGLTG